MRRVRIDCARVIPLLGSWLVAFGLGGLAPGCQPRDSLVGIGMEVIPPEAWRPVDRETRLVPGQPLAAWSGPNGSSLVVYRALPIPGGTAESIAASLANRLANLPGYEVKIQRVEMIDGRPAARVEVVAPGTGDALAPSSIGKAMPAPGKTLGPTREIVVGIAESDATLYLCWDFPESDRDRVLPDVEETLEHMRFPQDRPAGSKPSY